jgi:hypothetical protein
MDGHLLGIDRRESWARSFDEIIFQITIVPLSNDIFNINGAKVADH